MNREFVQEYLESEVKRLTYDDCEPIRLVCSIGLLERLEKAKTWINPTHFFDTALKDLLEEIEGEAGKTADEFKVYEDEADKADPDIVVLTKLEATNMLRTQTIPNDKILMVRGYGANGGDPEDFYMWSEVGQDDLYSYPDVEDDPFQGYENRDFQLWRKD